LESIKNKSDKNIKNYYFFKYHYFNLKIVYSFLNKLNKSWTKPKTSMCNKEIIKLYDENEMNNRIYFNLLDTKYTPSMKKAIFIFFGVKVILDKLFS
jgi:tagatose-1,6-bisphosphate aldolase non-catalytic subunit AgaZ/GatZ